VFQFVPLALLTLMATTMFNNGVDCLDGNDDNVDCFNLLGTTTPTPWCRRKELEIAPMAITTTCIVLIYSDGGSKMTTCRRDNLERLARTVRLLLQIT
jgi:hypothetical protein